MKNFINSERRYLTGILFLLMILTAVSCSKDLSYGTPGTGGNPGGTPGTNEVWIQGMAFTPSTITVNAGTTIKWTNKDGVSHTVTGTTGEFDSGTLGSSQIFTHKFDVAGSYSYYCKIHPGMTGTVIVM